MSLPQRKRLRLKNYDYSSPGCYFVTISTYEGAWLFGDGWHLNTLGKIVEQEILKIESHYDDVKIDNFIIMPNHIHMLITIACDALPNDNEIILDEVLGKNKHTGLGNIVGLFKSGVSKEIHKTESDIKNIWQRSYFDHIITCKEEYNEIWDYIDANPIRWQIKNNLMRADQDPPLR